MTLALPAAEAESESPRSDMGELLKGFERLLPVNPTSRKDAAPYVDPIYYITHITVAPYKGAFFSGSINALDELLRFQP